jgi:hypothetical protein
VLFCLPQTRPAHGLVSVATFNYAPVAPAVALLLATVWWLTHGRHGYQAPAATTTETRTEAEELV